MNCEHIDERLSAYYDNELSPSEMSAVAAHLSHCNECQSMLHEYASFGGTLIQAVKAEQPYPNTEYVISEQLYQSASQFELHRIRLGAITTATILACLLIGLIASPIGRTMWHIGSIIAREVRVLLTWYEQSALNLSTIIIGGICIGLGIVCFLYLLRVIRKFEPI